MAPSRWGGNQLNGPNAGNPPNPVNTNFASVRGLFYNGRSYYNALELQLAKRMSHGFQVQGVYTWSKSIDTSSTTVAGDAFGTSISSLDYFDLKLTRGLSDFNVGRTWSLMARGKCLHLPPGMALLSGSRTAGSLVLYLRRATVLHLHLPGAPEAIRRER